MRPQLITEIENKKQRILIIDRRKSNLGNLIKNKLSKYDSDIYYATTEPREIIDFSYIFLINGTPGREFIQKNKNRKIVYIFVDNKKVADNLSNWVNKHETKNVKVLNIISDNISDDELEKILWFSFSKSHEVYLNLQYIENKKVKVNRELSPSSFFTKKKIIVLLSAFITVYYLLIFPFMALSSYLIYKSLNELENERIITSQKLLSYAQISNSISKNIYKVSRPGYLFLSLALWPDDLITINDKAAEALDKSLKIYGHADQLMHLILKKTKSQEEKNEVIVRFGVISDKLKGLQEDLAVLNDKVHKSKISSSLETVKKVRKLLPYFPQIFAQNTERKYLLLFANNMEIRPGGGFIGSYGILTMKDLALDKIDVFDVYDADGRLTEHIEPPSAIREYLNQPNWFLRDSAFSPDFYENYGQAKLFLEKEMGLSDFSGGAIVTTTAIQNSLLAFGNIYLPDQDEVVNKENFYLKTQVHSEQNFFPGSIAKKSFLASLARQMIINMDSASLVKLIEGIKISLDEKQTAFAFEDIDIQNIMDSLYWSGRTIMPQCPSASSCVNDFIFPYDANLGVNKANFYVTRSLTHRVQIDSIGTIHNSFIIDLTNDSPSNNFPGGPYKNYFQILLPKKSIIKAVTKNGILVEGFDEKESIYKSLGFLVEIAPQKTAEIKIDYQLEQKIEKGKQIYQLVFQKQIGSKNSDINLEIVLPSNIHLVNQNFRPLVKDNRILYNTSLSQDKIFILELSR